ncbi:MAG: hypothetical protein ACE5I5_02840 [Candidatus Heimdallarchaeota archaeon]
MQNELAMKTTVVGSVPLEISDDTIRRVVRDLVEVGIDYVNYPQGDMHAMFLDPLIEAKKLEKRNKLYHISDDFSPPTTLAPSITRPVQLMVEVLEDQEAPVSGLRACVTGPFTIMTHMRLEDIQKDSPWNIVDIFKKYPKLSENIVTYVNMIAKAYSKECDIVSIDEPLLGLLVGARNTIFDLQLDLTTDEAIQLIMNQLNCSIEGIDAIPSIHVCGEISPLLRDLLLKTDVRIVDHEFRSSPHNFELFNRKLLESNEKMLAFGTLKTIYGGEGEEAFVENVKNIRDWIQKGIDAFGIENILIKPDCGFGPLKGAFPGDNPYQIVLKKLRNMVAAVQQIVT